MADPENERRWREAMERLGVETVRTKLRDNSGIGPGADVKYIADTPPLPSRAFVETWLSEREAAERGRRSRIDRWTLIFAAIGALTGLAGLALALILRG